MKVCPHNIQSSGAGERGSIIWIKQNGHYVNLE
jgi:hypothetical protein